MLDIPVGHAMFFHVSNGLWSIGASGFDVEVTSDPERALAGSGLRSAVGRSADVHYVSPLVASTTGY